MKNLLFISLCALLSISCKPVLLKGYHKKEKQPVSMNGTPSLLTKTEELQKYNMTFDFRKNHFSGLLLVKKTDIDTYRLLFNSHFGLSLFDIEITPDSFHIHQCIEPMRKKQLFKLLQHDFSTLLGIGRKEQQPANIYINPNQPNQIVYKLTAKKKKAFYLYNTVKQETEQVLAGKGLTKTLFCRLSSPEETHEYIKIVHCYIGIIITLQSIQTDHE